jgi:hypothetical protein
MSTAHDRLVASARVYRLIADPVFANGDGATIGLLTVTFDGDYSPRHVQVLVEALIREGSVQERNGALYPTDYEEDQ